MGANPTRRTLQPEATPWPSRACYETVRHWWRRFGPMFAAEIRKRRARARKRSTSYYTFKLAFGSSEPPTAIWHVRQLTNPIQ